LPLPPLALLVFFSSFAMCLSLLQMIIETRKKIGP
jgi:hypothetical protein